MHMVLWLGFLLPSCYFGFRCMYGESVSDMLLGNGALIVMCTGMRIVRWESDLGGLGWEENYM